MKKEWIYRHATTDRRCNKVVMGQVVGSLSLRCYLLIQIQNKINMFIMIMKMVKHP